MTMLIIAVYAMLIYPLFRMAWAVVSAVLRPLRGPTRKAVQRIRGSNVPLLETVLILTEMLHKATVAMAVLVIAAEILTVCRERSMDAYSETTAMNGVATRYEA